MIFFQNLIFIFISSIDHLMSFWTGNGSFLKITMKIAHGKWEVDVLVTRSDTLLSVAGKTNFIHFPISFGLHNNIKSAQKFQLELSTFDVINIFIYFFQILHRWLLIHFSFGHLHFQFKINYIFKFNYNSVLINFWFIIQIDSNVILIFYSFILIYF